MATLTLGGEWPIIFFLVLLQTFFEIDFSLNFFLQFSDQGCNQRQPKLKKKSLPSCEAVLAKFNKLTSGTKYFAPPMVFIY